MSVTERITDLIRDKKTQIPTLPVIVENILSIARDERTSAQDLADFVSKDQAISNKIIKLANSAYYGRMKEIDTIPHAITIIGFNEVVSLTIGMNVMTVFGRSDVNEILNMQDLWIHSIGCAFSAKKIAKNIKMPGAEQIFLNGILHDMGKVIFAVYFPEEYRNVIKEANNNQMFLYKQEKKILGIDHASLVGLLMERWHFPDNLFLPSLYHHNPDLCPPNFQKHAFIIELADLITQHAGIGHSGSPLLPKKVKYREKLGLGLDEIKENINEIKEEREKIEGFFELIK